MNHAQMPPTFINASDYISIVPIDHFHKMIDILKKAIPKDLAWEDLDDLCDWMGTSLPLISSEQHPHWPNHLSIYLFSEKPIHLQLDLFFPEIVRKWLIPNKEISILSFNQMYFSHKKLLEKQLFIGEISVLTRSTQDWHIAMNNLDLLSTEITTAIKYPRHAPHIFAKKISIPDEKATIIHRKLHNLLERFPHHIDDKILGEMDLFLAISPKNFLAIRTVRHTIRLVSSLYLFHKTLQNSLTHLPGIHHVHFRFLPTSLEFPFCLKPVLGCLVGIGILEEYEMLEERHLFSAIKRLIPKIYLVKESSYSFYYKEEKIKFIYIEIEKENNINFSISEKKLIKKKIKESIIYHIEKLMPPIFMFRNEEETLRNILMLRKEIRSTKDLPQAILSLDQQTSSEIIFSVLLVFVTTPHHPSLLRQLPENLPQKYPLFFERSQSVGYLRKKYPIDAHLFRLHLPKDPSLLRTDLSLNFYLAREKAASFLNEFIGEFRDYNGGIIFKQTEMLSRLKEEFSEVATNQPDLLEDFFYSISPIEKQVIISFVYLRSLFQMLLESLEVNLNEPAAYSLKKKREKNSVLVVVRFQDFALKKHLFSIFEENKLDITNFIYSEITLNKTTVLSYIYENQTQEAQENFINLIGETVEKWHEKIRNRKILHVAALFPPTSLDPRRAGDDFTGNTLRLLFEGLIRIDQKGMFDLGMAKSVSISPDKKLYTFKIRKSYWSNGDPVLAKDFEYSWKKVLSVDSNTPFAYLFYPIKNAKEAKMGLISLDEVGIKAVNEETLLIELAFPVPYFLELLAHSLYFPVNHKIDLLHPNWPTQSGEDYVCNGGFCLKPSLPNQNRELLKNRFYWDYEKIEIDEVNIAKVSHGSALELFKKGKIDWFGFPFAQWNPTVQSDESSTILHSPDVGAYWCIFNTSRFPFNHLKLRKAFAMAIDRMAIASPFSSQIRPAFSPLLPIHNQRLTPPRLQENLAEARHLFKEALEELRLCPETFPPITLIYVLGAVRETTAQLLKKQWETAFKIRCRLEPLEWDLAFKKMSEGDFHLGNLTWRSPINDPVYFLNTFRDREEQVNFSRWEKKEYQTLLREADLELDLENQKSLFGQAEDILIDELPVIPIFYVHFSAIVKNYIVPPTQSLIGNLNLTWTKIGTSLKSGGKIDA